MAVEDVANVLLNIAASSIAALDHHLALPDASKCAVRLAFVTDKDIPPRMHDSSHHAVCPSPSTRDVGQLLCDSSTHALLSLLACRLNHQLPSAALDIPLFNHPICPSLQ
ncbi:unnamed protein product [Cyclocybe aegerita]|uniref:Uncharacterized protein n=1 Tax=Cyclocybe aegerita TaxID=1973307 RepID=A0A8S0X5K4_CYCAE|nr:unnamed protein product [Cyclocybe aegerita]